MERGGGRRPSGWRPPTWCLSGWTRRAAAPVPPVLPETEEDRRRFAEAEIRRTHRLARRAAILASREQQTST